MEHDPSSLVGLFLVDGPRRIQPKIPLESGSNSPLNGAEKFLLKDLTVRDTFDLSRATTYAHRNAMYNTRVYTNDLSIVAVYTSQVKEARTIQEIRHAKSTSSNYTAVH